MSENWFKVAIISAFLSFLFVATNGATPKALRMFCYIARRRSATYHLSAADVRTNLKGNCTHYIYASAMVKGLPEGGYTLVPAKSSDIGEYSALADMVKGSQLAVLISVSGMTGDDFQAMLLSTANIQTFSENALAFVIRHRFDGIDIDWRPGLIHRHTEGNVASISPHKMAFSKLIATLREKLDEASKGRARGAYLLTSTLDHDAEIVEMQYDTAVLKKNLDFFLLRTYDYYNQTAGVTAAHNALRAQHKNDTSGNNQESTLGLWLGKWVPLNKLVLGIPTYGRYFRLSSQPSETTSGVGSPARTMYATYGPYSRTENYFTYRRICELQKESGVAVRWLHNQAVPYLYKDRDWITYENERSAQIKTMAAFHADLAGVAIWTVSDDDFLGDACSTQKRKFPIVHSVWMTILYLTPRPRKKTNLQPWVQSPATGKIVEHSNGRKCGYYVILPDMRDCRKFFVCITSFWWQRLECPFGLYFDIYKMRCEWPHTVLGCNYTVTG